TFCAADHATRESMSERRWALPLPQQALVRLRQEFETAGKQKVFDGLKAMLTENSVTETYAEIAHRLEMSAQAVKVAVHRLRRRYQQLLREEIAQTVASTEEIDEELRNLFTAVAVSGKKN